MLWSVGERIDSLTRIVSRIVHIKALGINGDSVYISRWQPFIRTPIHFYAPHFRYAITLA